ncbi:murein DD-endopeptidase MepM/ murein hydrolase activator NlpD [Actinoalloteichus hoggarensis]|uniref:Murein DD-endopeptidase MepM n=1 Tax=Actinoalloteichus hoggarensis TaxID=1470176 RepID=A0A221W677_9PSEU|nr:M23 family metallopeptidase [Actinoalloteichus hoggarensis]ASO21368.1 Murein DD-endopeptidase MepM [Actinoalloteichus hoggarensis]MBB5921301.1 murein DD-endopeptidase MepM/ murein hydrolase activator NlpD [Actinoalloteichus hoggarensis]
MPRTHRRSGHLSTPAATEYRTNSTSTGGAHRAPRRGAGKAVIASALAGAFLLGGQPLVAGAGTQQGEVTTVAEQNAATLAELSEKRQLPRITPSVLPVFHDVNPTLELSRLVRAAKLEADRVAEEERVAAEEAAVAEEEAAAEAAAAEEAAAEEAAAEATAAQEQAAADEEAAEARVAEEAAPAQASPEFAKPTTGTFTSGFGARWGTTHYGIDIANSIGTPIVSATSGTVINAGSASGFGQWVRVQADDGTITVYGHIETYSVSVGQRVAAGEQIATMGNRGQSTGPHLHFEVHVNGQKIDPQPWLAARGISVQ